MEELESFVWDRACEIEYPFGALTPPWEGDRMLSALALADAFAVEGGVREIVERFGDQLSIAVEAYRYYGFDAFATGIESLGSHRDRVTVSVMRSAFNRFGLRWRWVRTVGEGFEIVNAKYFLDVNAALTAAFTTHFRSHRDLYGPVGHPSTWH